MAAQFDAIRRFTDAWKRGDDNVINQITIEIHQSGNDADLIAMSRVMATTPHGSGQ